MTELSELERTVTAKLLAGEHPVLAALRGQLRVARAASREMTGAGFYTKFQIPAGTPPASGPQTFRLGDVNARAENLINGAGFLLLVREGNLFSLEGYSYDEPWPQSLRAPTLAYSTGGARDLVEVARVIGGEQPSPPT